MKTSSIIEGELKFEFTNDIVAIKFDDNNYYRKRFNSFKESKAVDIIAYGEKVFLFIKIKDFKGHETENSRRLKVNYKTDEIESLDIEMAKKISMTLSCVFGAGMYGDENLKPFFKKLGKKANPSGKDIELKIILFLEGDFKNEIKTFKAINDSIKKMLKWFPLDTKILVENIRCHNKYDIFKVSRI